MASKQGYRGKINGIHTCQVCGLPQTQWGASKAQVEASVLIQSLAENWQVFNTPGSATEQLINDACAAITTNLCQCEQGQQCACEFLGTMCRPCTARMSWCKCDGFGFNGERGTCIYCRTNVQPWMFAMQFASNATHEPSKLSKEIAHITNQYPTNHHTSIY